MIAYGRAAERRSNIAVFGVLTALGLLAILAAAFAPIEGIRSLPGSPAISRGSMAEWAGMPGGAGAPSVTIPGDGPIPRARARIVFIEARCPYFGTPGDMTGCTTVDGSPLMGTGRSISISPPEAVAPREGERSIRVIEACGSGLGGPLPACALW